MERTTQAGSGKYGDSTGRVDPGRWYRFIHWFFQWVYYSRVRLIHAERLPVTPDTPVLFLSTHRNGAVDGFIHHAFFPRATFLITRNLRRSLFLRLMFSGIEVIRRKDRAGFPGTREEANREALHGCQRHLAANGHLLVFPEGTSGLGPHRFPLQSGAARILLRFLEANPDQRIAVVPLGIHYERAWAFRSRAEVLVGHPVSTELDAGASSRARLGTLKRRIREALEEVGANLVSAESQRECEATAYVATLGTGNSYAETLKRFECHLPDRLAKQWRDLRADAQWPSLWLHQGVPLFPLKRILLPAYGLWFVLAAPWVALAALLNAPPLIAAFLSGRACADDRNVIALWRVLIGVPLMLVWFLILALTAVLSGHLIFFPAHLAVSLLGLLSYYRTKKLAVTIHNGLRFPGLREHALRHHRSVLDTLSHEHQDTSSIDPVPSAS